MTRDAGTCRIGRPTPPSVDCRVELAGMHDGEKWPPERKRAILALCDGVFAAGLLTSSEDLARVARYLTMSGSWPTSGDLVSL